MLEKCSNGFEGDKTRGAHTNLVKHLVALVQHEDADATKTQKLVPDESIQTAWGADNDVRMGLLVAQNFGVLLDGGTAIEHAGLDLRHILGESVVLVADLEGQLSGVAHHKHRTLACNRLDLLKRRKNEDGSFAQTRFSLANDVASDQGLRDASLLNCSNSFECQKDFL